MEHLNCSFFNTVMSRNITAFGYCCLSLFCLFVVLFVVKCLFVVGVLQHCL